MKRSCDCCLLSNITFGNLEDLNSDQLSESELDKWITLLENNKILKKLQIEDFTLDSTIGRPSSEIREHFFSIDIQF